VWPKQRARPAAEPRTTDNSFVALAGAGAPSHDFFVGQISRKRRQSSQWPLAHRFGVEEASPQTGDAFDMITGFAAAGTDAGQ
jgi:hypothetical protein